MPDMFSPCFDLAKTKDHPFNHLPLASNPYMTPDTTVCREEWARLLSDIKKARADAVVKDDPKWETLLYLEFWAEREIKAVNAYCDWVDCVCEKLTDTDYLAAIYSVNACNRFRREKHWKSLVL